MSNYYATDKYYDKPKSEDSSSVFGIRTIGASKWIGIGPEGNDPIKGIQAEMWAGAGHIEVTAPGTGRGGRGNLTFEQFDNEQRQAIRDLVKINKVNLSVHATPQVTLTGFGENGFSEHQRQRAIFEIQKAIDFSRDASSGGSVVVHTGEFPRALNVPGRYPGEFQFYEAENKDAQYYLVDNESGRIVKSVRANEEIAEAIYEEKDGKPVYMLDENGKPVYDDVIKEYILNKNKTTDWDKIPEAEKERARIKIAKVNEHGNIQTRQLKFEEFKDEEFKKNKNASMNDIVRAFYEKQAYGDVQQSLGQSRVYERNFIEGKRLREKALKELKFYKNLHEKVGDGDEWDKIKADYAIKNGLSATDGESKDPLKHLQEVLDESQRNILYGQETAIGGRKNAKNALLQIDKITDVESYALDKSRKSFAELGIYAMEQTLAAKKQRPNDDVKPIFITLENIYPEHGFGSHPEELMTLVKNAREEMAKELMSKMNYDKKRAEKAAEDHLKITFDTGHMNMWRKHYIAKPGETKEDTDKRFNDWYLKEVESLAKSGMIGNVHLADNFGYEDTHLAPGAGSAPIKQVLKILEKHGYNEKMVVEGGFDQGKNGFHETWKMVGAHIDTKYAKGRDGTDAWLNPNSNFRYVRDGYLGVANRPNFIFKGYSPDSDDWKPWSGLGME